MSDVFDHVLIPVASEDDARTTAEAVIPRVQDAGGSVVVVHVIEKVGGAPDKASVEQRREHATELLDAATELFDEAGVNVDDHVLFGTSIPETILDAADDEDATAIVFSPREQNLVSTLLTEDVAGTLLAETDRPLIVLPESSEEQR